MRHRRGGDTGRSCDERWRRRQQRQRTYEELPREKIELPKRHESDGYREANLSQGLVKEVY
jgi:hypothetical protein